MPFLTACAQNGDPLKTQIVTSDIEHFWRAFEQAKPAFDALVFEKEYIAKGSPGLKGFLPGRIKNADNLAKVVNRHQQYYAHELWLEFKARMFEKDFEGWLYSSQEGRPNDLGYWMGYQITKAYYDHAADKAAAIQDILNIRSEKKFLEQSGYEAKFK